MKKRILLLMGWLISGFCFSADTFAQAYTEPSFGPHIIGSYLGGLDDQLWYAQAHLPTIEGNDIAKKTILLGIKLNPNLKYFFGNTVQSLSKTYQSYIISDSTDAELIALGITKANIKDYRYRVVQNDSMEIVSWSKIPGLAKDHNAKTPYGFIGRFCAPGKQLLIEVVNVRDYSIRDGVVFDWRTDFTPIVTGISATSKPSTLTVDIYNKNSNKGYADRFDPKTGLPLNLKFPPDSVYDLYLSFKNHETFSYRAYLLKENDGKRDTTELDLNITGNGLRLDTDQFKTPGKYQILIMAPENRATESRVLKIPFEVSASATFDRKISLKQTLPYIIATLLGVAILFLGYYRYNRLKLIHIAREKQTAGLKLQSIRAQLNPHFMFNALTSIQNLINKNDIEGANHYLSKFAELTRQVLSSGNEEVLSIDDELRILDNYLQMEQLRFGFKYEINVDETLNKANIDVPAMLLQPFVENAVKHGVAGLKETGIITITVLKQHKDIIFVIKDNGSGFIEKNMDNNSGYGLKLSTERIVLLNKIYKDQTLKLHIDTNETGSTISLSLSDWIS